MESQSLFSAATDLAHSFARSVAEHGTAPAVVHNGQTWSYAELGARVAATARVLGPRPGVVGVLAARDPGTIAGLLGVLAAGGAYCPIDPTFPIARQRAMLAAAGCERVLVPRADLAPPAGYPALDVPAWPALDAPPGPAPARPVDPGDLAYTLFTSGSTGAPKAVLTPRGAIATAVSALRDLFELRPADRVLQFASLNWDTCFEEILPTLTTGAALIIDDEAHTGSFRRFLRLVAAERITVLDLPTAFWHELVHHLVDDGATLPPSLRLMIIGGEAVSTARLADWRRLATGAIRLLNTYGSTETTLITHAVDLAGPRGRPPHDRVPIGRALRHVRERITAEGELVIGGPAVALGYRDRAAAGRFVLDQGERFFRTGDRVERYDDGTLGLLGRLDQQLKIRGVRVDPAEVETHLCGHPGVTAAAVVGTGVGDHTALVAYVVARDRADPDALPGEILAHLRDRVPCHLIPSRVTVVPRLHYTASGKVDRMGSHHHFTGSREAR